MRSTGVHHVDLVVSNIARSLDFYRGLLGPLGWHGVSNQVGERGETIHYLYGPGSSIGLRESPASTAEAGDDRYRIGLHHLCLEAASKDEVDRATERLAELGAEISDGPREYPEYRDAYYAVFFFDPDGIKLEINWTPDGAYDYQQRSSV